MPNIEGINEHDKKLEFDELMRICAKNTKRREVKELSSKRTYE